MWPRPAATTSKQSGQFRRICCLHSLSNTEKANTGVSRRWYNAFNNTGGGCASPRPLTQDSRSMHCDEYPFYGSVEGGPAPSGLLWLRELKVIDPDDNSFEGTLLNGWKKRMRPRCAQRDESSSSSSFRFRSRHLNPNHCLLLKVFDD